MVNHGAAFNGFNLQLLSCVIVFSLYRLSSLFSTNASNARERKIRCPSPVGAQVPCVYVLISIRGDFINPRQRVQHLIFSRAPFQVASRTNCAFTLAYPTGRDALLYASHIEDVDVGHDLFNRTAQACAIPFSSSISRMYCGIASASGAIK